MEQMSMDFEANKPQESSQPKILSVSDVNKAVKDTLENGFKLIWMKGELSNFKPHTSGHWYFSLKDSKAQISAVMFRGFNQSLKFRPRDGMEVIVRGKNHGLRTARQLSDFLRNDGAGRRRCIANGFRAAQEKARSRGAFRQRT
jgi:exonuclease VII large subunit